MSWATKQRAIYILGVIGTILILIGVPAFFLLQSKPTCSDGVKNQGEKGVDCGGPCVELCDFQVQDLSVTWSRSFKVVDGVYNAVAYVENPNFNAGIRKLPYTFKLYDEDNVIVAERRGKTYIPAGGGTVSIFEASIQTGKRKPARTFFSIDEENPIWLSLKDYKSPLAVENIRKEFNRESSSPRLQATINNKSVKAVSEIEVVAVVFNTKGNAIGSSRTFIKRLKGGEQTSVTFTWPRPFKEEISRVDIRPKVPLSISQ